MTTGEVVCGVCAAVGLRPEIAPGLAGLPGDTVQVDRCRDRVACRERAERRGLSWPEDRREAPSLALPGFGGE